MESDHKRHHVALQIFLGSPAGGMEVEEIGKE
jgi:hypothetical protein